MRTVEAAFGHHEDRTPTHGYEPTREAAMAAFAKGWRQRVVQPDGRGGSNQHPALLERQDCTLVAWYPFLYAPRAGGAYDSHHRTAGIAGRIWRRGSRVAARGTHLQSAISVIGFSGFSGADVHDFRHSAAVHIQDFSSGRSLA